MDDDIVEREVRTVALAKYAQGSLIKRAELFRAEVDGSLWIKFTVRTAGGYESGDGDDEPSHMREMAGRWGRR
jgi:hypothetical protein